VWCRPVSDPRGVHWWRTEWTLSDVTIQQIDQAFQPENRVWDSSPTSHLARWMDARGTSYSAQSQLTAPVLGGLISGRSFINLLVSTTRAERDSQDMPVTTKSSASVAAPDSLANDYPPSVVAWRKLSLASGHIIGSNLMGGSMQLTERVRPDGMRTVHICMISATEIGGSLPIYMVNNATVEALVDMVQKLSRFLEPAAAIITEPL